MKRSKLLPYLLILPAFLIMTVLVFYPVVITISYSFMNIKLNNSKAITFIGLKNYIEILKSIDFWYSLQNSIMIMFIVVFICLFIGFIMAIILNVDSKFKNILMAISIIPWALPPIVNGILWKWIFYPGYGFLNKILYNLKIIEEPIQYLSNRYSLILIVSLIVAWRNIPFCSIVFLSSIRAIPETIYDAARIDGASNIQILIKIILPLLIPAFRIALTFTSISAINVFDEVISISGYSNLGKTILLKNYIITFSFLDFGKGSALTYLVMLIAGSFVLLYIKSMSKKIDYI